jgi:hypothetical protein
MGRKWGSVALCVLLTGCGTFGQSKQDADWDFATSTEVLGMSLEGLEARLGKPIARAGDNRLSSGAVLYQLGECQVSYDFADNLVTVVRTEINDKCKPGLKGIASMEGVDFAKQTTFGALPEPVTGIWNGSCIGGPICGTQTKIVSFFVAGDAAKRSPSITLNSRLVTKEEVAVASAWAIALIGTANIYSAELDSLTICGTSDQAQATGLLHGLKVMDVAFGHDLLMGPQGCPKANSPVSPRPFASAAGNTAAKAKSPPTSAAQQFSREKLVGGWSSDIRSCEGDSGISYNADGSWIAGGNSGTWRIEGNKLITTIIEEGEMGDESVKLKTPKRIVTTIVRLDDKLTEKNENGAVYTSVRCPSFAAPVPQVAAKPSGKVPPSVIGGAKVGMSYATVRASIIKAGFSPVKRQYADDCRFEKQCQLPETEACSGTGNNQCSYVFRKGSIVIDVSGISVRNSELLGQTVNAITYRNY